MLIASKSVCGVGGYQWEKAGDAGAIEIIEHNAYELMSIPGGNFYSVEGAEAEVEAKVPLQEDETTADDVTEAIEAANVGAKKATRSRKTTTKE
jgi:hypothetical protein